MDKISHILPASRRVTAVDTESSQPVRPGAPEYGRPSNSLEIKDKVSLSSIADQRLPEPSTYKNPKETNRAKVIEELSDRFYNAREMTGGQLPKSAEVLEHMEEQEALTPAPISHGSGRPIEDMPIVSR